MGIFSVHKDANFDWIKKVKKIFLNLVNCGLCWSQKSKHIKNRSVLNTEEKQVSKDLKITLNRFLPCNKMFGQLLVIFVSLK